MIVALAYNYAEQEQAGRLAKWIATLGPYPDTLILATEKRVTLKFFADMIPVFEDVIEFDYVDHMEHYPESKNLAFQQAALFVAGRFPDETHWFYLEPDTVPIRAGWIEAIETATKIGRKPFLGCMVPASPTHRTPAHMAAPGVYPINMIAAGAGNAMIAHEYPFPAVIAKVTTTNMVNSSLIFHDLDGAGVIPEGCVLFHPDRNGTILENLSVPVLAEPSATTTVASATASNSGEARESTKNSLLPEAQGLANSSGAQDGKGSEVVERTAAELIRDGAAAIATEETSILSDADSGAHAGSNPAPSAITPSSIVDSEGRFVGGLGETKTHHEPWKNRLESEERIKTLVAELRTYCTRPAYTAIVRRILRRNGVSKRPKKHAWAPEVLEAMRARAAAARAAKK